MRTPTTICVYLEKTLEKKGPTCRCKTRSDSLIHKVALTTGSVEENKTVFCCVLGEFHGHIDLVILFSFTVVLLVQVKRIVLHALIGDHSPSIPIDRGHTFDSAT